MQIFKIFTTSNKFNLQRFTQTLCESLDMLCRKTRSLNSQGVFGIHQDPSTPQDQGPSGPQAAAAAVLDPGSHKEAGEGDRDQAEHDAAEEGFNH